MTETATTSATRAEAESHHSFISRLTTGTGAFDVLGRRKYYYLFSSVIVLASILFIVIRGFAFGIDFAGGTQVSFPLPAGESIESIQTDAASVFAQATGHQPDAVQQVGTGASSQVEISSLVLTEPQVAAAKAALGKSYNIAVTNISDSQVSNTWGSEITWRAVLAVIIFLIAVAIFIWIRYESRVAVGAVSSVIHDLLVTAGIYAAVGFEVAPATIIGLLTILGFSLYDTVVVYDKVQENSKGLLSLTRRTYPEAANLAVNQTLMRSINTSLIALLPVAGLLVAGVAILGSGTLKDLALVLLVGMLVGAYSSVFVAVPLAVDLKMLDPQLKAHTQRVIAKRKQDAIVVDATGDPLGASKTSTITQVLDEDGLLRSRATAPRPGAKPVRPVPRRPAATSTSPASAMMVQISKPTADHRGLSGRTGCRFGRG